MRALFHGCRFFLAGFACCLVMAVPGLSYGKPAANGLMTVSCGKKYDWCLERDGYQYRNHTLYNTGDLLQRVSAKVSCGHVL